MLPLILLHFTLIILRTLKIRNVQLSSFLSCPQGKPVATPVLYLKWLWERSDKQGLSCLCYTEFRLTMSSASSGKRWWCPFVKDPFSTGRTDWMLGSELVRQGGWLLESLCCHVWSSVPWHALISPECTPAGKKFRWPLTMSLSSVSRMSITWKREQREPLLLSLLPWRRTVSNVEPLQCSSSNAAGEGVLVAGSLCGKFHTHLPNAATKQTLLRCGRGPSSQYCCDQLQLGVAGELSSERWARPR